MNLRLIFTSAHQWLICFEINQEERHLLLESKNFVDITSSLRLKKYEANLIVIEDDYRREVEPTMLTKTADFLFKRKLITEAQYKDYERLFASFYPFYLKLEELEKQLPSDFTIRNIFASNNPDIVYQRHMLINEMWQSVDERLNYFKKEIAIDNILNKELKETFLKVINEVQQTVTNKKQDCEQKIKEKIKFLQENPTYITNVDPEKQFEHVISNLRPLENKEKLVKKLLLDETVPLSRYRIKGKVFNKIGLTKEFPIPSTSKTITGITLYRNMQKDSQIDTDEKDFPTHLYRDASQLSVFEIEFANGDKTFYQLNPDIISSAALAELFVTHGAHVDFSSQERGIGNITTEFFGEGLQGYTKEIEDDYDAIHNEIASQFAKSIQGADAVEVVFIGCGKGEEITPIVKILEEKKIPYRIYAMDIEESNIEIAKNRFAENKYVIFNSGNAIHLDQFIAKERENKKHKQFYKQQPQTIAISSGCLTRKVNKDQKEAFDIFKNVAHFIDKFLISGRTATLISRSDAKKVGLTNEQHTYRSPNQTSGSDLRTLDIFTSQPIEEKVQAIFKQNDKIINLSEHSRPFTILKGLDKLFPDKKSWQEKIINLSDAYIGPNEIKKLTNFAAARNLTIIINGNEPWLESFESELKKLTNSWQLFKSTDYKVQILKGDPEKLTKFQDYEREIFERPKISSKLTQRATDTLQEEKTTKKKF